ncbi:MAG: NUDIX domain-containing protein [Candidatus Pacebacteria bacterium]|nr:NUDIX domain-containing protein [Candidatus Paceibacterota bacterium]
MIKSAGLIIITQLPSCKGNVAILHRRGILNEKLTPQSWPGGYQVTATGKIETGETSDNALERETVEELGKEFSLSIPSEMMRVFRSDIRIIYAVWISPENLPQVSLSLASGGLVPITRKMIPQIKNLLMFDKKKGVQDGNVIAMFPDEKEALKWAFNRISIPR